jgi:copper oxidase (laccase) domain-containing protein
VNSRAATLIETFPALSAVPALRHGFVRRVPGLDVKADRDVAMSRLDEHHAAARSAIGVGEMPFIFGQQVHGAEVATVDCQTRPPVAGVDGVIAAHAGVCLGVYVADCCAVYLVDPGTRIIALLHSGRKGTELGITRGAIRLMVAQFGCDPGRIIVQLSPCIRPPHYDVDFAAEIVRQCRASGVHNVVDDGVCTACHPDRYYSYRAEHGKTGRMLAMVAFEGNAS